MLRGLWYLIVARQDAAFRLLHGQMIGFEKAPTLLKSSRIPWQKLRSEGNAQSHGGSECTHASLPQKQHCHRNGNDMHLILLSMNLRVRYSVCPFGLVPLPGLEPGICDQYQPLCQLSYKGELKTIYCYIIFLGINIWYLAVAKSWVLCYTKATTERSDERICRNLSGKEEFTWPIRNRQARL